jgi:molecular chaperone GrpE
MAKKTQKTKVEAESANGNGAAEELLANPATQAATGFEEELAAAREEAATNYDLYVRQRAELENVLRRHEREKGERARYAAEPLARDLLPTVDNLERAIEHAQLNGGDETGILEGVEMVYQGLLAVLEQHGIRRIEALGRPFDPSQHEAVAIVESDEHDPNTVVAEHRAGYRLEDRLLRAAMVAVAKAPAEAGAEAED